MSVTTVAILQALPLVVVLAILFAAYVLPQWRLLRTHTQILKSLKPGDVVVTEGGLYATVLRLINKKDLVLELAPNVQIRARKESVSEIVETKEADDPIAVIGSVPSEGDDRE